MIPCARAESQEQTQEWERFTEEKSEGTDTSGQRLLCSVCKLATEKKDCVGLLQDMCLNFSSRF